MPYEVLETKIKSLPESYIPAILGFIELLRQHDEMEKRENQIKDTSFIDNMVGILSHEEVEEMRHNCHLKFKEINV